MQQDTKIEITIDHSLVEHFEENLARREYKKVPEDAIAGLIATILNESPFPIAAKQIGDRKVRITYHLRSFSRPIFWT